MYLLCAGKHFFQLQIYRQLMVSVGGLSGWSQLVVSAGGLIGWSQRVVLVGGLSGWSQWVVSLGGLIGWSHWVVSWSYLYQYKCYLNPNNNSAAAVFYMCLKS